MNLEKQTTVMDQSPLAKSNFSTVEIKETLEKGRGVFALQDFVVGDLVMVGRAVEIVPQRTKYSVQIGWDRHALFDLPSILSNHSCDPNCGLRTNAHDGYDFIARKPIAAGEEVTWDYCMSEYVSIAVDVCRCGAGRCRTHPTGYKDLSTEELARYKGFCAGYLELPPRQP